jgi:hypothetical protein
VRNMTTSKLSGVVKELVAEIIGDGKLAEEGKEETAREPEPAQCRLVDAEEEPGRKDLAR